MAQSVYPGGITVHINSDLPRWKSKEVFPVLYFTGMLKKALSYIYRWKTSAVPPGMSDNKECGFGTTGSLYL